MKIKKLNLNDIKISEDCQPRIQMDAFVINDYKNDIQEGANFPPLDVYYDGEKYWLADGFHRIRAARDAGLDSFDCRVHKGTKRDAILHSVGANASHGLRRTNRDKQRAVRILLEDDEWSKWSDREIARRAGVGNKMVSRYRKRIRVNDTDRKVRRGDSIYTMDVTGIKPKTDPTEKLADGVIDELAHTPFADSKWEIERIAKLPEKEQIPTAKKLASGEATSAYDAIRKHRKESAPPAPPLPEGTYNVLLADPPWSYEYQNPFKGSALSHYSTMDFEDILEMDLPDIDTNAVLFLWVTVPYLKKSFEVIDAWGFEYKTNMVWIKTERKKPGIGHYVRNRHEFLFIATRGSFTPRDKHISPPIGSYFEAPIGDHSQKPQKAYEIIEALYPDCKYIELFARKEREGWVAWGDEINEK